MKKFLLVCLFLFIAPITLGLSIFSLNEFISEPPSATTTLNQANSQLYAALPQTVGEVLGLVDTADARPVIVERYLRKHNSPLLPYVEELLAAAAKYDVDYRLIIAIAQCESNLCKRSPAGSFNCWGFENGATRFLSWEQALNQVAKTLRERYLDYGLTTPEEIMPKYAPPSVEKGGPWAKCVNQFIKELEFGKVD